MTQLLIKMHPADNVAVVVTAGGLPAGTQVADGLSLVENIPQGHKVALETIAQGNAVIRYNVVICLDSVISFQITKANGCW